MQGLKKQIADGSLKRCYLFYGSESYLIQYYENELKKAVLSGDSTGMNLTVLTEKEATASNISGVGETLPFLSEKRLIIARDSKLFVAGRKDEAEKTAEYISNIPETTVLLFVETEVDRRGKLYKKAVENGYAVEFKPQSESDLIPWAASVFKKYNSPVSSSVAALLVQTAGTDMNTLMSEIRKLCAYKGEGNEINTRDIEYICTKSTEARIFELSDAVAAKNAGKALEVFSTLTAMKEPPIVILSMIARQIKLMLQCKHMTGKKASQAETAAKLGLQSFIVRNCVRLAAVYSEDELKQRLYDCYKTDVGIKTGKTEGTLALEMLIVKFCGHTG